MAAVLIINGTTIDRVATHCTLISCRPYVRGDVPTLRFARLGVALSSGLDAWDAQPVQLIQDGTTIFSGDTASHLDHYDERMGWVREWTALGLLKRADYIPITDSNTTTDCVRFNISGDSPDFIGGRAGRTVGEAVADVLEMSDNRTALIAAGIGNYTSTSGSGGAATAVLASGSISSVTVANAGSGYTTAPTVLFSGGGGSGATATASVSAGAITGISVVTGGSGYTSLPTVILSTLPTITLTDLATLSIIPPGEFDISGDSILSNIEDAVNVIHPNHFLHVDPDGNIRFIDPRGFTPTTLTLGDPRVGLPQLTVDWSNCYSRCLVRGDGLVRAITLGLLPTPGSSAANDGLAENFAHDGLTNAQAKTKWKSTDFNTPGLSQGTATATAALSGATVGSITVSYNGYGYTAAPSVLISGGGGTGATATASLSSGGVGSVTVTAAGSGYTSAPTVTIGQPGVGNTDLGTCTCPSTTTVTVTSAGANDTQWPSNYWDQSPSGRQAIIVVNDDTLVGNITQKFTARIVSNTAKTPGGTSTLTLDQPLPSTTYNTYQIFGIGGGASIVYRKYSVVNPAISAALANYFPYAFAAVNSDGTAATLTSTPIGTVFYSSSGSAPYEQLQIGITIDQSSGNILTAKPTALVFSADGITATPVNDFRCFLPINTGALKTVYPADISGVPQYTGTANSLLGLTRTKILTVRDWRDLSNSANMLLYATEWLSAFQDVVYEGTVPYLGLLSAVLAPGSSINIDSATYTTGLETAALPVTALVVEYNETASGTSYTTNLSVSNRRQPYSGAIFVRPSQTGQMLGGAGLFMPSYGAAAAGIGESMGGASAALDQGVGDYGSAMSQGGQGVANALNAGLQAPDLSSIDTDALNEAATAGAGASEKTMRRPEARTAANANKRKAAREAQRKQTRPKPQPDITGFSGNSESPDAAADQANQAQQAREAEGGSGQISNRDRKQIDRTRTRNRAEAAAKRRSKFALKNRPLRARRTADLNSGFDDQA